jgi:sugar/nucleoside kinase (ribokinase family)
MQTYLGSCTELGVRHITPETFGTPKAVLIEGYVWDLPEGPQLARRAMDIAAHCGTTVALSLSDSFCVERHRESFCEAVEDGVQIVVADEDEMNALLQTKSFDDSLDALDRYENLFVMTRSAQGSVVVSGNQRIVQPASAVDEVIDTTGAGDAYCAGFLYGWVNDLSLEECAKIGTYCGAAVVQQIGGRIEPGVLDDY